MAAKFVIKSSGDEFLFNLIAANGQTILTSQRYKQKASAKNGIESVRTNATDDERFERLTAKDDSPYFVLKAANAEVIGTSQMYKSAANMEAGIASVKECSAVAELDDQA